MRTETLPTPSGQRIEKLSEAEEKTFDLLVTEHKEASIDMSEFANIPRYAERLDQDKASVERKKAAIKRDGTEPTKKACILEAIFAQQIELSNWLGQNILTIVPAEYDDLFHGVDLALEVSKDENTEYLALGIDATSSSIAIRAKLKKIKEYIANGTLTMMEYFHSENRPDFYGVMKNIPQVVIGIEGRNIQELSELWMTAYGLPKLRRRLSGPPLSPESEQSQRRAVKDAKDKLGRHRVQMLILEEIKMQLSAFRNFAIQVNQNEVAQKFSSLLELLDAVLKEKDVPDREDVFKNSEDHVFQALSEAVSDFENL